MRSLTFFPEPVVKLENAFHDPFDNAVATARTCYSARVITSEDVHKDDKSKDLRDRIAESIYKAGHHTTIQHATFQFILDKVSRQFIWSFLHSHPFYNCIDGETKITHFHSGDKEPWTIAELYQRFHDPVKKKYIEKMHIRSVDTNGNLVPNRIKNVISTGVQPVFKVKTALGYMIRATKDHRFMRKDGSWARLHELGVGEKILVNGIRAYKDPFWLKMHYHDNNLSHRQIASMASTTPATIRKWVRRFKLQKPLGSWSRGISPPSKGHTKETYEPLMRMSAKAKLTGRRPPLNGRESMNSNWKGKKVKNPRDRARLWYAAEVCEVCDTTKKERRIERHHINKDIYDNSRENIIILCSLCHKAAESPHRTIMRVTVDRIVSIQPDGDTETYDLVMEAPHHNFVANGFVVHNSEQVSQRYVEVSPENFVVPPLEDEALEIYLGTIRLQMEAYQRLMIMLEPVIRTQYEKIFPNRDPELKRWNAALKKRGQEVARYVLPVATHAHLYHTISGLTLHRYHKLCDQFDTPFEQKLVVKKMIEAVNEVDPLFFRNIEDVIPLDQTPEYRFFEERGEKGIAGREAFLTEFDASLGPLTSKLVDYHVNGQKSMAQAARVVLGLTADRLSDEEAIDLVMDPAKNPYFGEALNLTTLGKLTRTMVHPHFTFQKKISHTADSQDQRHRMTPASRPVLFRHFVPGKPDFIVPALVKVSSEASDFYAETMRRVWNGITRVLDAGASEEFAMYLLPNAFPIRFLESGDLLNHHHKWTKRLCYTAQEEIWNMCRDEVMQVSRIFPQMGRYLLPPCGIRNQGQVKPYCPEGDRFCGVPAWKLPVEAFERLI